MNENNIEPEVIGGIGEKKSNGGTQWYQQDRIYQGDAAISITTSFNPSYAIGGGIMEDSQLRIRKLTERECGRLMGVKDEDITKIAEHQSGASQYHLYGDSICVPVLMAILGQLLDIDWSTKYKPDEWWHN